MPLFLVLFNILLYIGYLYLFQSEADSTGGKHGHCAKLKIRLKEGTVEQFRWERGVELLCENVLKDIK